VVSLATRKKKLVTKARSEEFKNYGGILDLRDLRAFVVKYLFLSVPSRMSVAVGHTNRLYLRRLA
jgi:hypothetical protein